MDLNQTTQKVQEAVQAAQALALRYGHQEVDGEHAIAALLDQSDGLAPRLLERLGVAMPTLKARIDQELNKRPRVSGGGTEEGKV